MSTERAIRDAVPKLEAIANGIDAGRAFPTEPHPRAVAVRLIAADLLSAVEAADPQSGPTTAQEGPSRIQREP